MEVVQAFETLFGPVLTDVEVGQLMIDDAIAAAVAPPEEGVSTSILGGMSDTEIAGVRRACLAAFAARD
jgi:hypothetical protein